MKKPSTFQRILPLIIGRLLDFVYLLNKNTAASIAVRIFCTPRGGKIKNFHKKFLDSTIPKTLHLDNQEVQTYYIDNNSERTILLAHGWESNAARWKKLTRYLKDLPVNIVMLDGPAHGASGFKRFTALTYAKMINQVVNEYEVDALVGHSIGAFSCGLYTKIYPETKINHFVILASPDTMTSILEEYQRILGFSDKLLNQIYKYFEVHFPHDVHFYRMANFMEGSQINGIIMHDPMDMINTFDGAESIKNSWGSSCHLIPMNGLGHGLQSDMVYENVKTYLDKALHLSSIK